VVSPFVEVEADIAPLEDAKIPGAFTIVLGRGAGAVHMDKSIEG